MESETESMSVDSEETTKDESSSTFLVPETPNKSKSSELSLSQSSLLQESESLLAGIIDETIYIDSLRSESHKSLEKNSTENSEDPSSMESQSLLSGISPIPILETDQSQSQSLLASGMPETASEKVNNSEETPSEIENSVEMSEENTEKSIDETVDPDKSEAMEDVNDDTEETEEENEIDEPELVEVDNEDENDENTATTTQLPFGRVRKLMKICVHTNDEEELAEIAENNKSKKSKGKGSKNANTPFNPSKLILTKEAIYVTAIATELFVAAVTQQSSKITSATKKKTMTVEHLKRALTDSDCYEFLQGCFNPSLLIGD